MEAALGMKTDRETQRRLVGIIKRLDEALELLDQMDRGDGDGAAFIQRAVNRAKRELRFNFGRYAAPLPSQQSRAPGARSSGRPSRGPRVLIDRGDLA